MSIMTLEGITEQGHIKLKTDVRLPDNIRVYVVVPDVEIERRAHIHSPRLAHPEQAVDFKMDVTEEASGAEL